MKNDVPWQINKKYDLWIYSSDAEIEYQEENTETLPKKLIHGLVALSDYTS